MNYNHTHLHTYTYIFVSNVHIIWFVDFFQSYESLKMYLSRNKKSINVFLTTEFSREIIETAVQIMNQIYTILHLYVNRNGSFNQENIHARTYEKTYLYTHYNITLLIYKNRKNLQKLN